MSSKVAVLLGGCWLADMSELYIDWVQATLPPDAVVAASDANTVIDFEDVAEKHSDLAILILNNIVTAVDLSHPDQSELRKKAVLDIVRRLSTDGVPVISQCADGIWTSIGDLSRASGARFHLPLPCKGTVLRDAIRQCLVRN